MSTSPLKTIAYGLVALLVLALLLVLTAGLWLPPIAEARLVALVDERSGGQYALEVDDIDLRLFAGTVRAEDVRLVPARQQDSLGQAAAMTAGALVEGSLGRVSLAGISWWDLVFSSRLNADVFLLEEPRLKVTSYEGPGAASAKTDTSGGEGLRDRLPAIAIGEVRLRRAHVDWGQTLDTVSSTWSLDALDLTLRGLRLDSFSVREQPTEAYESFAFAVAGARYELADSVHVVSFDSARFDSRGAELRLARFAVRPQISEAQFAALPDGPPARLTLAAEEVLLGGFALDTFLRKQHYRARTFRTDSLTAEVFTTETAAAKTSGGTGGKSAPMKLGIDLQLDSLDLRGMHLTLRRPSPRIALDVPQAELLLTDVRVRPEDRAPTVDITQAELRVSNFAYAVPGTNNAVRLDRAVLHGGQRSLSVEGFRYGPPDADASQRTEHLTLLIAAEHVGIEGLDVDALLRSERLSAKLVTVEGFDLESTTNFAVAKPTAQRDRDRRFPIALVRLQNLPLPVSLGKVEVERARVAYRRIDADHNIPLTFDATYATLYDVHTAPDELPRAAPRLATADIRTRFQDKLDVKVKVTWPNGSGSPYDLEASTGAIDLARFNDLLEPMADIRVEGGRLERLAFDWRGENRSGAGRLSATYTGFEVNLLDDSGDDKDLVSLFANLAAVKEDSRGRSGRIFARREGEMSMWGHWWALIKSGLVEVALTGIGEGVVE